MMTGFSMAPLQLASLIGFACTLFGIGIFLYVFIRYCLEGSVPGFPFLASIIAIFSGAQLFALGVIGEYLARMHFRSMKRPAYVVRTSTAKPAEQALNVPFSKSTPRGSLIWNSILRIRAQDSLSTSAIVFHVAINCYAHWLTKVEVWHGAP